MAFTCIPFLKVVGYQPIISLFNYSQALNQIAMKTFILTIVLITVLSVSSFASFTKSYNGKHYIIKDSKGAICVIMEQDLLPNKQENITVKDLQKLHSSKSVWYCVNNFCF